MTDRSERVKNRIPRGDALAFVGLLALALAAAGCPGHHDDPLRPPLQGVAPDFSLIDVNPNSVTHGQAVSPRQYLGKVSAWYFGHAT